MTTEVVAFDSYVSDTIAKQHDARSIRPTLTRVLAAVRRGTSLATGSFSTAWLLLGEFDPDTPPSPGRGILACRGRAVERLPASH